MVPIGGGSTKSVLSDRWIVYTKSRKQLLHRKYLLYETGCMSLEQNQILTETQRVYTELQVYNHGGQINFVGGYYRSVCTQSSRSITMVVKLTL